ncbi:pyrimidine 5'-nucleotidase [Neisseriaceae bacterium ESL0693]|nr:pyrimidine 5'-nucleotidase [Neisseriaceae bacterium ESL0693]
MTAICWIFDLDNTLHHADQGIFQIINQNMTAYIAKKLRLSQPQASGLRQHYWQRYGATLAGLQQHHPECDLADFLKASHPIPDILPRLRPVAQVAATLAQLDGEKFVFSNGPTFYVQAIIENMQLSDHFQGLFGIDRFHFYHKPQPQAYEALCRHIQRLPQHCIMVDDQINNLHTARQLGMHTIWFGQHTYPCTAISATACDMHQLLHIATSLNINPIRH